ncbi:MAG: hypothetical protein ACLVBA_01955 [Alistipes finegoldii]|uniref:Uncharacterized protein n=1 Tax=Alistipes finegoldii TaxID=214856 RepID=A0ABQ6S5U6_9BACT|nr:MULTISPECIES: hypothetical protein [Alistipes]KAA3160280.1 hypothetical protein F2A26_03460 [Alistipes finegoldii]MBS6297724.1 hypothetical protein [Alistipes sp.]MBV4323982.1 hypothetical protein [Alistipes finegoldii]MBV4369659.1 hypothetical protein [Alistipes finegoldii]MCB6682631.1 hypothetical protein [Alistipes finegoldii]
MKSKLPPNRIPEPAGIRTTAMAAADATAPVPAAKCRFHAPATTAGNAVSDRTGSIPCRKKPNRISNPLIASGASRTIQSHWRPYLYLFNRQHSNNLNI